MPAAGPRRLLALAALAVAVGIGYTAMQGLGASTVYYFTPTEARTRTVVPGTTLRLGGQVLDLRYDPSSRDLRFVLSDGVTRIDVVGSGAPPALLRERAGAVVEGSFSADGSFRATSVLAKHNEVYAPPSPGATPAHRTPAP